MKYDSHRKLARNAALYDLHVAHPEMPCEQLAGAMLPWGKLSRQRVHQLLHLEERRRAQLAQITTAKRG